MPQRYPLMYEYVKQGRADYTSFYTYNDGVMKNNIMLLLEAWEKLGNEEYRKQQCAAWIFISSPRVHRRKPDGANSIITT